MATKEPDIRNFIRIGSVGLFDQDRKRAVCTIGYSGKPIVAPKDLPITTFVMAVVERSKDQLGWSSIKAVRNDISKAIKYLRSLPRDIQDNKAAKD